jgi:hypothetical protein
VIRHRRAYILCSAGACRLLAHSFANRRAARSLAASRQRIDCSGCRQCRRCGRTLRVRQRSERRRMLRRHRSSLAIETLAKLQLRASRWRGSTNMGFLSFTVFIYSLRPVRSILRNPRNAESFACSQQIQRFESVGGTRSARSQDTAARQARPATSALPRLASGSSKVANSNFFGSSVASLPSWDVLLFEENQRIRRVSARG